MTEDQAVREWAPYARRVAREFFLPGADHDDVEQEALIGLLDGLRDYRPELGRLQTFLHTCIRRQLITALKTARRLKHSPLTDSTRDVLTTDDDGQRALLPIVDTLEDPRADPVDILIGRDELAEFMARMETLSPLERRAVIGLANGLTYAEIDGGPAGVKPKWVDNALTRARRKLAA